jgi:2-polyprenyl-3-methyl-5-hydroxy-6-metoxy-1,4-benzoquinol methylase
MCNDLAKAGFEVTGCDPSEEGVALARRSYPDIRFFALGVHDDPGALRRTEFDVVVSTEVIEHLFLPRLLTRFAAQVVRSRGHLILSTPYHGYLKNVALSVTGNWDRHFSPLWDGGHIKFWSRRTLSQLLREEGFVVTRFMGAGRVPLLWKSMIVVSHKSQ